MKKSIFSLLLFVIGILFSSESLAQKLVLTDEEVVVEIVTKEIDDVFKSEEFLKKKNKKFQDIKGTMVVDISVIQNGKVSTFF